ncbi:hypothetical protein D6D08_10522 [Aureobasidium pullulans]|nr:hypothetical protein D6D08_10522 [Aureobasidium pullulans]
MVGRIDPISNDYVPGGRYVDVTGSNLETCLWALAMGMANDMKHYQRHTSSSEELIGRYYSALGAIFDDRFGDIRHRVEDSPLIPYEVAQLITLWNSRFRDKYRLFIDTKGKITPWTAELSPKPQTVLIRLKNKRWQPCGYFRELETITAPPARIVVATRHIEATPTLLKPQPVPQLHVQAPATSDGQKDVDSSEKTANDILKTAASIESTATKLHTTSAKLVPAIEKLTEALEKHRKREEDLQTAIEKLTAAVERATLVEHQRPR